MKKEATGGAEPFIDKQKLVERIGELVAETEKFLLQYGQNIEDVISSYNRFLKIKYLHDAVDALSRTSAIRKNYLTLVNECSRLVKHTNRGEVDAETMRKYNAEI